MSEHEGDNGFSTGQLAIIEQTAWKVASAMAAQITKSFETSLELYLLKLKVSDTVAVNRGFTKGIMVLVSAVVSGVIAVIVRLLTLLLLVATVLSPLGCVSPDAFKASSPTVGDVDLTSGGWGIGSVVAGDSTVAVVVLGCVVVAFLWWSRRGYKLAASGFAVERLGGVVAKGRFVEKTKAMAAKGKGG